jgi:hypothetical protein
VTKRDCEFLRVLAEGDRNSNAWAQAAKELWLHWRKELLAVAKGRSEAFPDAGVDYESAATDAFLFAVNTDAARFWSNIQGQSPSEQDKAIGHWLRKRVEITVGDEIRKKRIRTTSIEDLELDPPDLGEQDEEANLDAAQTEKEERALAMRFGWLKNALLLLSPRDRELIMVSFAIHDRETGKCELPPATRTSLAQKHAIKSNSIRVLRHRIFWRLAKDSVVWRLTSAAPNRITMEEVVAACRRPFVRIGKGVSFRQFKNGVIDELIRRGYTI